MPRLIPQQWSRRNGHKAEIAVLGKSSRKLIDNGDNIEVKSTQKSQVARDGFRVDGRRKGRFRLFKRQQDILLCNGGKYVFVLFDKGRIVWKRDVSAMTIEEKFGVSTRRETGITHDRIGGLS